MGVRLAEAFENGSENQNVDPTPGVLSTSINPPIVSTTCRAVASPRPTP